MTKRSLISVTCCSLIAITAAVHVSRQQSGNLAGLASARSVREPHVPAIERALRPNYPYSVIPGGVYSVAELRSKLASEGVLREHYKDFNLEAAHLVVVPEDRYAYVSYRMKDRILWTSKKLRIPKGEVLISDGVSCARTRCGNRLSDQLKGQVPTAEPLLGVLNLPPFSLDLFRRNLVPLGPLPAEDEPGVPVEGRLVPKLPAVPEMPPGAGPSTWAFALPPVFGGIPSGSSHVTNPPLFPRSPGAFASFPETGSPFMAAPTAVSQTPEPKSVGLLGLGLLALSGAMSLIPRKRAQAAAANEANQIVGSTNDSTLTE